MGHRRRAEWGGAILTCLGAFGVYVRCLAPGLPAADAGEQITSAHFLGISHPTGTPLYLLLMNAWESLIPAGTVAWRMNLLNAVWGALAVGILFLLLAAAARTAGIGRGTGLVLSGTMALTFAFSRTFWYESAGASSYLLHYLFLFLWLFLFLGMAQSPAAGRRLWLLFAVSGLALGNHILALAPLGVTTLLAFSLLLRGGVDRKGFLLSPLAALPGLLLYLYIPLRSRADPIPDWGNPETLPSFLHYITRQDYHAKTYVETLGDLLGAAGFHARAFLSEMTMLWPAALLVFLAAGLFLPVRQKDGGQEPLASVAVAGCLLATLNFLLVAAHGSHNDLYDLPRYMVPAYAGLFTATAVGVLWAIRRMAPPWQFILSLFLAVVPLYCLFTHWQANDRSRNRIVEAFAREVLAHVPAGGALFAQGDNYLFPLLYYHHVEGMRPDVRLLNPRLGLGTPKELARLLRQDRLWTTHPLALGKPYRMLPHGLIFKVSRSSKGGRITLPWAGIPQGQFSLARAPLERIMLCDYCSRRSVYHRDRGEQDLQRRWAAMTMQVPGDYDQALMLTGRALLSIGRKDEAASYFRRALKKNPKNRIAARLLDSFLKRTRQKGGS